MRPVLILFVTVLSLNLFGQNQNNVWYFGDHAGLDFSSNPPTVLNDGQLFTAEGNATISDDEGNLLFYTDGGRVWDAAHDSMPNSSGLLGHNSSTQSALIVPKPESCDLYYIFTVPSQDTITPLAYSVVDMSLRGGLGDVTLKNVGLYSPVVEKLTGILHANGTDYWVLAHESGGDGFLAFLVTNSGVSSVPVISNIGTVHGPSTIYGHGYMKASPDGSKICVAIRTSNKVELFDFDNETGEVSNTIPIGILPSESYGIEFSPDNSKLYISSYTAFGNVFQYDLLAGTSAAITGSAVQISDGIENFHYGALQLSGNGKIYVNQLTKKYVGVINAPNLQGAACSFQDSAIYLENGQCQGGLPNFIKEYSDCKASAIEESSLSIYAKASPNPFTESTTISLLNLNYQPCHLDILNTAGQIVRTYKDIRSSGQVVHRETLENGIYFYRLWADNGQLATGKLIVN